MRVEFFWKKVVAKVKGASVLLNMQVRQNAKIFSEGYQNKKNMKSWAATQEDIARIKHLTSTVTKNTAAKKCLIMPYSIWKKTWDVIIIYHLIYTALIMPFNICFEDETTNAQFIYDLVMDSCFMMDVVLTFFTAI